MGSGTRSRDMSKKERLYKVLVIGEPGTGKTSIIKRYVHDFYSTQYKATIGVDFALKVVQWDDSTTIRLQIWDIAGQEQAGPMSRVYYKEAVGAFVVFDLTRVATYQAAERWKSDLDSKVFLPNGDNIPVVLLANKCDQVGEGFINSPTQLNDYCRDKGFVTWLKTSAKENIGLEEAGKALISKILENDDRYEPSSRKEGATVALATGTKAASAESRQGHCNC